MGPPLARPSNLPTDYSVPLGGGDVIPPTIENRPRPALLAAAHLEERRRLNSDPLEHWFDGSGATLVYEDADGKTQTRRGRTELRFYEQGCQNFASTHPPPPPQRVNEARVQLFRYSSPDTSVDGNPGANLGTLPDIEPSLRNFRLDPTVPVFDPRTRAPETTPVRGSESIRMVQDPADRNAAEALLEVSKVRTYLPEPIEPSIRADSLESSNPDENVPKTIKFVRGGVLPGTLDRSRETSPSLRIVDLEGADALQNGTCATPNKISSSVKEGSNTRPNTTEPGVAAMDVDGQTSEPPDSPPDLEYPTSESTDITDPEPTPEYQQPNARDPTKPSSAPDNKRPSATAKPRRKISEAFLHYAVWKEVIGEIKQKLKEGGRWTDREIQECLSAFSLLPWWYDINLKESDGPSKDWETWRTKIVDIWRKQRPNVPPGILDQMVTDLRELDRETRSIRNVQCQAVAVEVELAEEDVEMKNADAPKSPQVIPVWVPSSPPPEVRDAVREATTEARIVRKDWTDLQERVWTLGKNVADTTEHIQDRLTSLGDQVYQDGIIVTDLKWRMAEIQELEEKAKTAGKRAYKKGQGKVPTHRYPTRFSGSQADEVLELSRKEFGDVAAKIAAVEERMEGMRKETERLEAELTRVDALTPKIDALSSALEEFKVSQLKINFGSFQHFANLRDFYTKTIGPRLDAHSRDIAGLHARYDSLYAVAVDVLRPSQNGRRPPLPKPKFPPVPYQKPLYAAPEL